MELKVGQKVVVQLIGNAARYKSSDQLIEQWEVAKVGRKYFYAAKDATWRLTKFEITTGLESSNYSADYRVWESEQDLKDHLECESLLRKIRDELNYWRPNDFSLDQLRDVARALKIQG